MKKMLALIFVGLSVVLVMASCKSSSGSHCDAYGKLNSTNHPSSDLTSK